ncbi:acetyl-CoA carboxylase biotin carboxyl carrier protein [Limibaculum sp. M0105]|uniref:Biotin carboxyl carrier protein of acetyl-CoA carboxylase n=1 Tax=Thermohalobaculum xanthum TaxID=2753746 RepID=A0A8J7M4B7_9RHOB|nr:acetyl-CoA carboxylase biotin carboxyl carrier protein [Thermohalobaculum xanthum]MBK0397983.1 acetyl-CoA carboxylase biotin carboxyl carrier protein [Thermohalobaculum xanthum]
MSKSTEDDVAFIRALAQLLRDSDLTEIEVEREYGEDDEMKVRLSRAAPQVVHAAPAPQIVHAPAPAPAAQPAVPPAPAPQADAGPHPGTVASPMVGTVYLASEPGSAPFVQVGDTVTEGQTLLIIEAMKTMNQIPAPRAGKVVKVLVANAEPVEFGAPLMIIE